MRQVLWLLYKYEVLSDEHFAASKYAKKTGYGLSKSSKKLEVRLDQMGFKINVEGSWLTITVAVCLKCSCLTAVLCALCAFYQYLPEAAISRLQPRHTHTSYSTTRPIAEDPDTWTRINARRRFSGRIIHGKAWPDQRLHEEQLVIPIPSYSTLSDLYTSDCQPFT
jgi:hypothetical protein